MPGVTVKDKDNAGGTQGKTVRNEWFRLTTPGLILNSSDPVITLGDTVHSHGNAPHDEPEMVEGESWFRLNGAPVCRAGHKAACGHATTGRPWFRLESGRSGFRPYREVPAPKCSVEHIPWIMRARGWDRALALMERWFTEKESTDKSLAPDTTTITMSWLLGFSDVLSAYQTLTDTRLWTMINGKDSQGNDTSPIDRLCRQLANRGLLTDRREVFDDFGETPQQLRANKRQIDRVKIDDHRPIPSPDELVAALNIFELFLVVAGYVEPGPNGHVITILKAGVFAQVDYDFNNEPGEDQSLGDWNIHRFSVEYIGIDCAIKNSSFQAYRNQNHFGGDFEVYSDMLVTTYPDGDLRFTCSAP